MKSKLITTALLLTSITALTAPETVGIYFCRDGFGVQNSILVEYSDGSVHKLNKEWVGYVDEHWDDIKEPVLKFTNHFNLSTNWYNAFPHQIGEVSSNSWKSFTFNGEVFCSSTKAELIGVIEQKVQFKPVTNSVYSTLVYLTNSFWK